MRLKGILFLAAVVTPIGSQQSVAATGVTVLANGPVHEAFVSPTPAAIVIEAQSERPPAPIDEKPPATEDSSLKWIPGYWTWDDGEDDYVWVSGVLRRSPPEHRWIPGAWEETDEGWVWLRGFWSAIPKADLEYIEKRPPEPLAQPMSDGEGDDSFWMPGYWKYDEDEDRYEWLQGSWQELDPDWVLTPAHYSWRPKGYLFHPAYWDWPIEERGSAYANIAVDPSDREGLVYEPATELEPVDIVRRLVLYYPNYLCFFNHHYHYHPRFWAQFWGTPPWWQWSGWWSLNWRNQWALWWWYTHPGYPNPRWLDVRATAKLPPPRARLLRRARALNAPAIVTPRGVVPAKRIYNAMGEIEGRHDQERPILPANRRRRADILERAEPPPSREAHRVRPSGRRVLGGGGPQERVPLPVDPEARERRDGRRAQQPALPRVSERPGREVTPRTQEIRPPRRRVRPIQEVRTPAPTQRPRPEAEETRPPAERVQPAPRPTPPPPPSRSRPDRPPRPPGTGRNRQPLPPLPPLPPRQPRAADRAVQPPARQLRPQPPSQPGPRPEMAPPQQPSEPTPSVAPPTQPASPTPPPQPPARRTAPMQPPSQPTPSQPPPEFRAAQPQRARPRSDGGATQQRSSRRAARSSGATAPQATPSSRSRGAQPQGGGGARSSRRWGGGRTGAPR